MRFLLLWLLLLGAAVSPVAHAQDAPDVTVIHSVDGLQAMNRDPGGRYALGRSIDARATRHWNGGAVFAPIGREGAPFTGSFEGRGHAIHGLFIYRPGENDVGLFGHARNAALRDVRLIGGQVTGGEKVGALVGHNEAAVGNARIDRVCAWVPVTGFGTTGGLVGHNEAYRGDSAISQAQAGGSVRAMGSHVGGLVGHNEAHGGTASVSDAYASGTVTGRDYVGGLVGYNDALRGAVPVERAHASGAVRASGAVAGGLVGLDTQGRIVRSFYATTDAQGQPINRFAAAAAGQGLTRERLWHEPDFARWRELPDGCVQPFATA